MLRTLSSPGQPARLLRQRVREFFHHLPGSLAGEEDAIHQLRVAGRRIRVIVPVVAPAPEGRRPRRIRRVLRAMVRTAGAGRDLDVGVELFEAHAGGAAPGVPETAELRRRLRASRSRWRRRMIEGLLEEDFPRLHRDLGRVLARGLADRETVLTRLDAVREAVRTEALAALDVLGDRFDPDELHRLRTCLRRFRYTVEVDAEVGGAAPGARRRLRRLREFQEELGQTQDAHVLAGWLARQAASARTRGRVALAGEAERLAEAFVAVARAHHRAFLALDPRGVLREVVLPTARPDAQPLRLVR